jgi:glycerophosphoryl diester phosphodiesterase
MNQKKWYLHRPMAHRGLHSHSGAAIVPENSLMAFELAVQHQLPMELDVRLSSDEIPMVFHDLELARMTGQPGEFSCFSSQSLRSKKLLESEQVIPSLADVFNLVQGKAPILLELKADQPLDLLKASIPAMKSMILQYEKRFPGALALQSFHPLYVQQFFREFPHIPRGLLLYDYHDAEMPGWEKFLARNNILTPLMARIDFLAVDQHYLNSSLVKFLSRFYPTISWTVRNKSERLKAEAIGARNIIFENLSTLEMP